LWCLAARSEFGLASVTCGNQDSLTGKECARTLNLRSVGRSRLVSILSAQQADISYGRDTTPQILVPKANAWPFSSFLVPAGPRFSESLFLRAVLFVCHREMIRGMPRVFRQLCQEILCTRTSGGAQMRVPTVSPTFAARLRRRNFPNSR
jgi:hypothetical protein